MQKWKYWKSQRSGGPQQTESSGHDKTVALVNSQILWFPAQDLHTLKAVNDVAQGKAASEPHPNQKKRISKRYVL